jgi:hypothetical protein
VYCRVARGEFVFDDPLEANWSVGMVRQVGELHRWKVFAWCLIEDYYHLVVKTSSFVIESTSSMPRSPPAPEGCAIQSVNAKCGT